MTAWRWAVVGLVAAALLFGAGWWIGHRSVTTSEAERAAWQAGTDSLLGAQREAHRREVEQLLQGVTVDSTEIRRLAARAAAEKRDREKWQAEADTLTAMLAFAKTAADSIPIYQGMVAAGDSALGHEIGRGDSLDTALDLAEKSKAVLLSVIAIKDTRITVLEGQLASAPKPSRYEFRLLGLRTRCGAGVMYGTRGADIGVACVAGL